MYKNIRYEIVKKVAIVQIDRPNNANSINTKTQHELVDALGRAEEDCSVGCIMFTATGDKMFCPGFDLKEVQKEEMMDIPRWINNFKELNDAFRKIDKPLVAYVNGTCAGGGLGLALHCDIIIAAPYARFGEPEINIGMTSVMGSAMLWRALGRQRTLEMVLTGKIIEATEALSIGLITEIMETKNPRDEALSYCKSIAEKSPFVVRNLKQWLRTFDEENYNKSFDIVELVRFRSMFVPDTAEGIEEFFKKKKD